MQFFFDAQQLLLFVFFDRGNLDARPARHNFFDIFARNDARGRIVNLQLLSQRSQVLFFFSLFFGIEPRLFEFVIGDGCFHAVRDELHALLHLGNFIWKHRLAQLHARTRLVQKIDGLIRQKTVGNIPVRQINCIANGFVRVADCVKFFVAVSNALQHTNRFLFIGRGNLYRLEPALERTVFLHRLAIFSRRSGANALNLAAAQSRFQNIGGVKGTFGRTGAHQRVQFVDKHDGVLALHQFLHDGLQPLFKLSAVFRSGHDQGKVQRKNALVGKKWRHISIGNSLRQPFDDRGFPYSRFTDQDRVVLRAPAENLNRPLEFFISAHQRVELTFHRSLRQVAAEFRQ